MKIKKQVGTILSNEKGMVLPLGLIFLAIIALLGTTAVIVTTTDLKIGSNYKTSVQAFYDADSGVQYAIANIEAGLAAGTLDLSGFSVTISPAYTAPSGFSFSDVDTLAQIGSTSNYSFQVTAHSGNANSTIEVVIARDSLFQYGAFGDKKLDMKSSGAVYSYDSSVTPNPTPDDSTGEADVGSNEKVHLHEYTYVDGNVGLGDDSAGNEATCDAHDDAIVTGDIEDVPRVDPDPLGAAIGGDLDDDFVFYSDSANNYNASADPPIIGNEIDLDDGDTMILKTGNYYLTSIVLKKGSTLEIVGTANIYLDGEGYGDLDELNEKVKFHAHEGSSINIDGDPPDFTIFSNSEHKIDLKHGTTFKGTIYAPFSKVRVSNDADVYGMIWANEVDIKDSGELYFDTALKDEWLADTVKIVSWREILN